MFNIPVKVSIGFVASAAFVVIYFGKLMDNSHVIAVSIYSRRDFFAYSTANIPAIKHNMYNMKLIGKYTSTYASILVVINTR